MGKSKFTVNEQYLHLSTVIIIATPRILDPQQQHYWSCLYTRRDVREGPFGMDGQLSTRGSDIRLALPPFQELKYSH